MLGARLAPPRGEPGGTQPIIYSIWVCPTWLSLGGARWDPPVRLLIRLPVCGGARLAPNPSFAAAGPPSAASGRGGVSRGRWGMATVWISCSPPKVLGLPACVWSIAPCQRFCACLCRRRVWWVCVEKPGRGRWTRPGEKKVYILCVVCCVVCAAHRAVFALVWLHGAQFRAGLVQQPGALRIANLCMRLKIKTSLSGPSGAGPRFLKALKKTKICKNPGFCGKSPFF